MLLMRRINNDVSSWFNDLFLNFVIAVIVFNHFFLEALFFEGESFGLGLDVIICGMIIIWSRFHF